MKSITFRRIARGIAPWLMALAAAVATAAHAQNSPSPLAGEGRGEGATNNVVSFEIPAQELPSALIQFSDQTGIQVVTSGYDVVDHVTNGVRGSHTVSAALNILLEGTGLTFQRVSEDTISLARPQGAVAGQNTIGQRRPGIEEIIVTGQKKEERIQDVPIAISAFTQEDLKVSQIAGGPDLHLQVPNMTFTKTNFTGYSIQIRGIGTQAISATTDPAVAVGLNNTTFIRNRFFEQEFYDLERLEVLRGPQGTLYGRNATAGVVNLISAKPKFQQESMVSLDKGNYNSQRWEFMVNTPLVEDAVALRIAGAGTKRDGYATNEITGNPIDGRDLWSTRVSLRFAPTNGKFDANLIWEHFEEDDDRLRSGKQICHKDVVTEVTGFPVNYLDSVPEGGQGGSLFTGAQATFSKGCKRGSLYSDNAYQTVNGLMLGYYLPLSAIGLPAALNDPYATSDQSKDLRVIESTFDPEYRARSDIGELQISYELTDTLTLDSETAYMTDEIFSLQDFNRFNTAPGAWEQPPENNPNRWRGLTPGPNGGVFCDPQLGCSDRLVAVDISSAESSQFSQEFRLSSQFDGPFNFSLGANYLRYDTEDKYYVFSNAFTLGALQQRNDDAPYIPGESTNRECMANGLLPRDPNWFYQVTGCTYVEQNPIHSLEDTGHNYFLSRNPYHLRSYAVFGESYWNLTDDLKLTAGLRWSVDKKKAPRVLSSLLVSSFPGSKPAEVLEQEWREPTGRLVLDWKPTLDFTDETLLYGSYSHGYKAGGANPPTFTRALYVGNIAAPVGAGLARLSAAAPRTFDAEFVDAFEVGTKNTLLDGALTLNLTGFYYNYENYQISELVERAAFNKNYDLTVRGLELEADLWATERLRLGLKAGYQRTRVDNGEKAFDFMDRVDAEGDHFMITDIRNPNFVDPEDDPTAPEPLPRSEYVAGYTWDDIPVNQEFFAFDEWIAQRPFPTQASSCILPAYVYHGVTNAGEPRLVKPGGVSGGNPSGCEFAYQAGLDPVTEAAFVPNPTTGQTLSLHEANQFPDKQFYPGFNPEWAPNNGEGFFKDIGGNELPNAPRYTVTVTVDYVIPLKGDWIATAHTDLYWQDESWWRIFNDHEFGRLDDYFTMNVAAIFKNDVSGWDIMAYVKNVTDEDAITGAFLYTDDLGLPANTFLVEPRLYGVRVTKHWDGGGPAQWLGTAGSALLGKEPGEPSPWELTVGGQILRPKESSVEPFLPTFITEFEPDADPSGDPQRDLGWGDGREIVLTYAPDNGWRFSLGARFGESNRDDRTFFEGETFTGCSYGPGPFSPPNCPVGYGEYNPDARDFRTNYGLSDLSQVEEHLLVDFMVGREVGLGNLESVLSAGLRYAKFESSADITLSGQPDWQVPDNCLSQFGTCGKYNPITGEQPNKMQHTDYRATLQAEREFEGMGPVIGWDASMRLFGRDDAGHVDLDWSLSGGVLFGKQKALAEGTEESAYFDLSDNEQANAGAPESETFESFRYERDDDSIEVVPTLGAGLGLTYRIGGAAIGAGYHWERYYGAIDGGFEERKSYDRTIDGPYLKVTFGGGS